MLAQAPRNFKGFLMILKEWTMGSSIDKTDLSKVAFWVQIHGLLLEVFDVENAKLISRKLGEVEEVDSTDDNKIFP